MKKEEIKVKGEEIAKSLKGKSVRDYHNYPIITHNLSWWLELKLKALRKEKRPKAQDTKL